MADGTPGKVTNNHLYDKLMEHSQDRIDMERRLIREIAVFQVATEGRLSRIETCVELQKADVDMLKKRDWIGGTIVGGVAMAITFLKDVMFKGGN